MRRETSGDRTSEMTGGFSKTMSTTIPLPIFTGKTMKCEIWRASVVLGWVSGP